MSEQKAAKKPKRRNPFNRLPINPPKGWREKYTLPGKEYRVIPK